MEIRLTEERLTTENANEEKGLIIYNGELTDEELDILSNATDLRMLRIYTDKGLKHIRFLENLKDLSELCITLDLDNEYDFSVLENLKKLKEIEIEVNRTSTQLKSKEFNKLKNLSQLELKCLLSRYVLSEADYKNLEYKPNPNLKDIKSVKYYQFKHSNNPYLREIKNSYDKETKTIKVYDYDTVDDLRNEFANLKEKMDKGETIGLAEKPNSLEKYSLLLRTRIRDYLQDWSEQNN